MNDLPINAVEIYALRTEQLIASEAIVGETFGECQGEIAPGESVWFQFAIFLSGMTEEDVAFTVMTPDNPNGGFQIAGSDSSGTFSQTAYGGDDFNTNVGTQRGGVPGDLLGFDTHIITGNLACGQQGGKLKLKITEASNVTVMPGSNLQIRRIANSRPNEVGA